MRINIGDFELANTRLNSLHGGPGEAEWLWNRLTEKGIDPSRPFFFYYSMCLMATVIIQDELAPPHYQQLQLEALHPDS